MVLPENGQVNARISNIPPKLRAWEQFVAYGLEERAGKRTKVPYNVHTGRRASSTDPATHASLEAVWAAYNTGRWSGIGFVLSELDPFMAVDLDGVRDPGTGAVSPEASRIMAELGGYVEISPSGTGIHIIVEGFVELPNGKGGIKRPLRDGGSIEIYRHSRFLTITGDAITDVRELPERSEELQSLVDEYAPAPADEPRGSATVRVDRHHPDEEITDRLRNEQGGKAARLLDGDISGYPSGSEADQALVNKMAWYTQDPEQIERMWLASGLMRDKLKRRPDYRKDTIDKALRLLNGKVFQWPPPLATLDGVPQAASNGGAQKRHRGRGKVAHTELRDRWRADNPGFVYSRDQWWEYAGGWWKGGRDAVVQRQILDVLEDAERDGETEVNSFLIASVSKIAQISAGVDPDVWDSNPDALVCKNKTLDISTRTPRDHSPGDYATSALPYDYDPEAKCPRLRLVINKAVPECEGLLQEFAGYCLTPETDLETALWFSGKPGGGKSTIIEGLAAMLGARAGSLGLREIERSSFALSNIPGKTLLTATEQPTSYLKSTDLVDKLISGESILVDRKYAQPFEVVPTAKILWSMNELPRVGNANAGIFRRVHVIGIPEVPKEARNPQIKQEVRKEGAGILNWALDGLERLRERGHFEFPHAVEKATTDFKEKNDVPLLFVREELLEDKDNWLPSGRLYDRYKNWCIETGHKYKTMTTIVDDWDRLGLEKKISSGRKYWGGYRFREIGPR